MKPAPKSAPSQPKAGRPTRRAAAPPCPPARRELRTPGVAQAQGRPERVGQTPALLLACGNALRQDDAIGLRIAEEAERLFPASELRVIVAQQFTPEMADDLAHTDLAIFVDAGATDEPGAIQFLPLAARAEAPETHRLDPPALLALSQALCGHAPAQAFALTVGAGSFGYGSELSAPVRQAVPRVLRLLTIVLSGRCTEQGSSVSGGRLRH